MVRTPRGNPRAGYALLAMLWICVGLGALTWLISQSAREAMAASRNRMALTTATWRAQQCLAYARETLRDAIDQERARRDSFATVWNHVDRVIASARAPVPGCSLSARALGSRLDVNASDRATLSHVLHAAGMPAPRADSAAAALTEWRDHRPFVDRRELHRVRGLEGFARLDSVLDVEPGPLVLNQAPAELLALLPGFTERTIREVIEARDRGMPIMGFHALSTLLDPRQPDASAKLPGLILLTPPAWLLVARVHTGTPAVTSVVELRISPASNGTVVTRRRSWIE